VNSSGLDALEPAARALTSSWPARARDEPLRTARLLVTRTLLEFLRRSDRSKRVTTQTFWGTSLDVLLPDAVAYAIAAFGIWEPELTRALIRILRPGMTFFDVGAHIGYFTVLASTIVGPDGSVHAFEPAPVAADLLRHNAATQHNVFINQKGLWREKTTLRLHDFGPALAGFNSVYGARSAEAPAARIHSVDATTVDAYVQECGARPDVIKIDAESSELAILEGCTATIRACRPRITVEVGDCGATGAPSTSELIEFVRRLDYLPFDISGLEPKSHTLQNDDYAPGNLLLLPKTRST
jgi:FkbM family methyltransferase